MSPPSSPTLGPFPDPLSAADDEPIAVGADFRPETVLTAYRNAIFPWPEDDGFVGWWSPDPRAVFPIGTVHVSRSLARTMRRKEFTITTDTAFDAVMDACGDREEGTWITPEMKRCYYHLHLSGYAHSLEVWRDGALIGGIYGVTVGTVFTGESMFHTVSDASKVALVALDAHLGRQGFSVLDAQLHTDHLQRMGVVMWPRARLLYHLDRANATF